MSFSNKLAAAGLACGLAFGALAAQAETVLKVQTSTQSGGFSFDWACHVNFSVSHEGD